MLMNEMIIQILNADMVDPELIHSILGLDFTSEITLGESTRMAEVITPQF